MSFLGYHTSLSVVIQCSKTTCDSTDGFLAKFNPIFSTILEDDFKNENAPKNKDDLKSKYELKVSDIKYHTSSIRYHVLDIKYHPVWFKQIENKKKQPFIQFDFLNFDPSISNELGTKIHKHK